MLGTRILKIHSIKMEYCRFNKDKNKNLEFVVITKEMNIMIREKIINELQRLNFAEGYVWMFVQYLNSFYNRLNPIDKKSFKEEMDKMCDEGIFTKAVSKYDENFYDYKLTEFGEQYIYHTEEAS